MFDPDKFIPAHLNHSAYVVEDEREGIRLHKNENPFGSPLPKWYNRYPNNLELMQLADAVAGIKRVSRESLLFTNGTLHALDLLYSTFCQPGVDNVIVCPPTYHSFKNRAFVRNIAVREAPLDEDFQLSLVHLENLADDHSRILWLCSPNNPAGNILLREDVEMVLNNFSGLVVIDEAYINYSRGRSFLQELSEYPNLVVLQSFSIAWGLAALRISSVFAHPTIITALAKVNATSLSSPVIELALKALEEPGQVNDMIKEIVAMRIALADVLNQAPFVTKVYPSEANFLMVKFIDGPAVYQHLLGAGILVKNLHAEQGCANCLRITIGTEQENTALVDALITFHP